MACCAKQHITSTTTVSKDVSGLLPVHVFPSGAPHAWSCGTRNNSRELLLSFEFSWITLTYQYFYDVFFGITNRRIFKDFFQISDIQSCQVSNPWPGCRIKHWHCYSRSDDKASVLSRARWSLAEQWDAARPRSWRPVRAALAHLSDGLQIKMTLNLSCITSAYYIVDSHAMLINHRYPSHDLTWAGKQHQVLRWLKKPRRPHANDIKHSTSW